MLDRVNRILAGTATARDKRYVAKRLSKLQRIQIRYLYEAMSGRSGRGRPRRVLEPLTLEELSN